MAKTRVYNFTFTPGAANAGTVKLQGRINLENILLITNLSKNKIIFNFADATQGTAAWSHNADEQLPNVSNNYEGVTTLTLKTDTSAHSASDKLTVYVEDMRDATRVRMAEVLTDSVDKLRVSQPQSLIDTDFEYSVQPSKWEQLSLVQNHQSYFPKGSAGSNLDINALSGNGAVPFSTMTATTLTAHGLVAGDIVSIQETENQIAEGTFIVLSGSGTTLTYAAKGVVSGSIFSIGLTTMSGGGIYDASGIPMSSAVVTNTSVPLSTKTAAALTVAPTVAAYTNLTGVTGTQATIGATTIVVSAATNLVKGLGVTGTGIPVGTYITNIAGTTVTISAATTAALSATALTFNANGNGALTSRALKVSATTNIIPNGSFITATVGGLAVPVRVLEVNSAGTATNILYLASSITSAITTGTALSISTNAGAGATVITLADTVAMYVGAGLDGSGLDINTAVTAISGNQVTISPATTGSVNGTISKVGASITVTTQQAHGLFAGSPIIVTGSTSTTFPPNGNYVASTVATPNTFIYTTPFIPTGSIVLTSAKLYARPEGYVQHRSLDGGVQITTGSNLVGSQQIRQTRRYFRYQSGKGIQFSTGVKFTPTFDVDNITASGTTATITTLQDHNLMPGATILVENVETSTGTNHYNGTFPVASITGTKTFTYTMAGTPADTAPGGTEVYATCTAWKGATVRSGLFDDQNGFYFEFDGKTLFTGRRQAIKEMFGKVTGINGSSLVTGTNTRFRKQLIVGDKIVIKGQCYEVAQITSDTSMIINPAFRGPTVGSAVVKFTKVQNFKWAQADWNLDKMDGTGPSGYNLKVAKMQMAYIDYTWYGAGHIRYGFRGPNGDIVYVHKVANNNINTSAYMRSGNLPGRFETFNFGYYSKLVAGATGVRGAALAAADTTLYVENAQYWPDSGTVVIQDSTNVELAKYTSVGAYNATVKGYPLLGLTRRYTGQVVPGVGVDGVWSATAYPIAGTASSVTFTPDTGSGGAGASQVGVQFLETTCAPVVSHWGVSVIMDGRYDNDKEVRFTAGQLRYLSCQAGVRRPLFAVRIAPSVDSGIGRNFGVRELINRMQLTLKELGVYSQGQFLVEGVLNPSTMTGLTFPTAWTTTTVGSGSLAQVAYWDNSGFYSGTAATATGTVLGGDRVFGVYSENSGGANFSATRVELDEVRDLGTSILSGDGSAASPCYPNGPDVLVICVTLLEATGTKNIAARMSWTEAQA